MSKLQYGQLEVLNVYDTEKYEVIIQSHRSGIGGVRRLCICDRADEARDIKTAVEYALKNGVIE